MRSIESKATSLSLAIIMGIGLAACGLKSTANTSATPTPSSKLTGEKADLVTDYVCDDRYRLPDGTCIKGGIETLSVQVCSLTRETVVIIAPDGQQTEAQVGTGIEEILPKPNGEPFIPCP